MFQAQLMWDTLTISMSKTPNKIKKISRETVPMKMSSESKLTKMNELPKWIKFEGNYNQILQTNNRQISVHSTTTNVFMHGSMIKNYLGPRNEM